jgi:nitroreductase
MTAEPTVFETMYSLRAMRRLKPDRVPEDLIWKVLEAGTKAPSGGDSQPWRFIVVQDPGTKAFIQERYKKAWDLYLQANLEKISRRDPPPTAEEMDRRVRMGRAATYLAEHLHEVPVLILVCMTPRGLVQVRTQHGDMGSGAARYASIFPAVENMLLACRALGLGATLTTLHLLYESEIKGRLGIPDDVETVALLPIGYPMGRFGPTTRLPVGEVTYWDRWGQHRASDA